MGNISISANSSSRELETIAMAIHQAIRLPIVIVSLNRTGIIIEKDRVVDYGYIDPILETALEENRVIRTIPRSGRYKGTYYIVSPLHDDKGQAIAAIGIVDIFGITGLTELFGNYSELYRQVDGYFKKANSNNLPR
jgi:hypothetical protein